ncbi:MAG: thiamine pyrophosphate-dependent enzyme, partial [Planctomycetia bacterium]
AGGLPRAGARAGAAGRRGRPHVTICFCADRPGAEGEFHEALNLAALWNLPVLFLCENNRYAMGTALVRHQAMPIIHRKGAAYGVESAVVDGMDVLAVEAAVRLAVESVRGARAPHLLEARTYRFRAHSMYDPELYRPKEEVERWRARDPLATFPATLQGWGLVDDGELRQLEAAAAAAVDAAVAAAEAAAWEPVEDLTRDVLTPAPGATP